MAITMASSTPSSTVHKIVNGALGLFGGVGRGKAPQGWVGTQGLEVLNDMISNFSQDSLIIPNRTSESLPISAAQISYTIGVGGDFDTDWILSFETAFFRESDSDYYIFPMTKEEWDLMPDKRITIRPTRYYYEPAYPLGTIYFNYKPPTTLTFHPTTLKPILEFASLATVVTLPRAYKRMLKYNLACEWASYFGKAVPRKVEEIAITSLDNIKGWQAKHRIPKLFVDGALLRDRLHNANILTGDLR